MLKLCPQCKWQFNDEISHDHCPHPQLSRQMKRNHLRLMQGPTVNLDQQEIARKQIAAMVRLKRMGAVDTHLNAALQYLTNVPDERRSKEATDNANAFVAAYFENASKNVVDLTSELAAESFTLLAQREATQPQAS